MAYHITDACIACGACQAECPTDCIDEGGIFVIRENECIDCGSCAAVCPTDACQPE